MRSLWQEVVTGVLDLSTLDGTTLEDRGPVDSELAGFELIYLQQTFGSDLNAGLAHLNTWCLDQRYVEATTTSVATKPPTSSPPKPKADPGATCLPEYRGICPTEPIKPVCKIDDYGNGCGSPAPVATSATIRYFTSPSGNLECGIDTTSAFCLAHERAWSLSEGGDGCAGSAYPEAGAFIEFFGRADVTCMEDDRQGDPPLALGQSLTVGDLTCTSKGSGVSCRNTATDHGFDISKATVNVY